jgi:hypothetical protein
VTGKMLRGVVADASSTVNLAFYDATSAIADATYFNISGSYEVS